MKTSEIYCSNPSIENNFLGEEIREALQNVMDSGTYILGQQVSHFESEFANYLDASACVGVNSGTDAIAISLRALGIGHGDEVVIPSHTAVATASAVVSVGAVPVFAEVSKLSMTIDPISVENVLTKRTKAVIAVHLYGFPCDLDPLVEICSSNGIFLLEDCAQAHGAEYKGKKVGTVGIFGCFSFYPTKNLGAVGDGGAIVTNDVALAEKCKALRQYGWDERRTSQEASTVSRLDEIQASILRVKLRHLDDNNRMRKEIAKAYKSKLSVDWLELPSEPTNGTHAFHLFVIKVKNREKVLNQLNKLSIFPGIHYTKPVHSHPAFSDFFDTSTNALKYTEELSNTILSLPMYPGLTDDEIDRVVEGVLNV